MWSWCSSEELKKGISTGQEELKKDISANKRPVAWKQELEKDTSASKNELKNDISTHHEELNMYISAIKVCQREIQEIIWDTLNRQLKCSMAVIQQQAQSLCKFRSRLQMTWQRRSDLMWCGGGTMWSRGRKTWRRGEMTWHRGKTMRSRGELTQGTDRLTWLGSYPRGAQDAVGSSISPIKTCRRWECRDQRQHGEATEVWQLHVLDTVSPSMWPWLITTLGTPSEGLYSTICRGKLPTPYSVLARVI
jgi:hypothetical protein